MRWITAVLMLELGAALAQGPGMLTPREQEALVAATAIYSACIKEWVDKLAPSKDAADLVAGTVLAECREPLSKFILAVKPQFPSLGLGEVRASLLIGQKQYITNELIKRRVTAVESAPKKVPARTREGKLAECDMDEAEFRRWAAERGHVRFDMIEERSELDQACRAEANKLPPAGVD